MTIQQILHGKSKEKKKALFVFDNDDREEIVLFKFNIWARYFFGKYFTSEDASFHKELDRNNLRAYRGKIDSFTDIVFRGGAKTARTKLFIAFVIANDQKHFRKYFKVLASDGVNSKQIVTDIYNMFISISGFYPEIFKKTQAKREETMGSFTTSTGIKVISDTVGTEQRGAIQENVRPDFIWFEDFENRKTLRSAVQTIAIWDNMEEARTGLSKGGSSIYTCNYLSEAGNVHKLVQKKDKRNPVIIIPIIKDNIIAWSRYTKEDIEQMKRNDDDFEGERLCNPSISEDMYFDRKALDRQEESKTIEETAGFKIFHPFDSSHRTAGGHDISGGVGLDSSTSVYIDFDTMPARVIATFKTNKIKPEAFGYEIVRQNRLMGKCLEGIENNYGTEALLICKQHNLNLYRTEKKDTKIVGSKKTDYGWNTNSLTKPKMLSSLAKAVKDGLIDLSDKDLIQECKSYTRNDLIENIKDPRITTRHFDLLIACAIAWQMKDFAIINEEEEDEDFNLYSDYS